MSSVAYEIRRRVLEAPDGLFFLRAAKSTEYITEGMSLRP
jgi:hypothetical protein